MNRARSRPLFPLFFSFQRTDQTHSHFLFFFFFSLFVSLFPHLNPNRMALEVEKLDSSIQEENQEAQVLLDKVRDFRSCEDFDTDDPFILSFEKKKFNLSFLATKLNNVKKSSKLLPEEVQRLREEISLKKDLFQQRESEMQHGVDAKQSKLNSLQELADLYGERLGLSFKQANGETEDNALCISFTQIDRRNPEKPFWFNVRIMDDDTYSIQKVVPEVNGMKELEEELNTDNNFSKFVRKMRRKFKESV